MLPCQHLKAVTRPTVLRRCTVLLAAQTYQTEAPEEARLYT